MANRTVNRQPFSVPVKNLQEKYFNFADFKGLCTNKNYLGIDQETFIDVNNLYTDQDKQLSSRPPVKRIEVLPADETVIEIVNINSITFYHTSKENLYYLHFLYKGEWRVTEVTQRIRVLWFDERFVIFKEDSIVSFNYNYELSNIEWFDTKATLYVPIASIITNGVVEENETLNYLTTSKIIRYIFDSASVIDTAANADLTGKSVIIRIGQESFSLVWQLNNEKVLTSSIGTYRTDLMQVSNRQVSTYLATRNITNTCYLSLDGSLFYPIKLPTGVETTVTFADDGSAIWCIDYASQYSAQLYYMSLASVSTPGQIAGLTWTTLNFSPPANYQTNSYIEGGFSHEGAVMSSTSWTDFKFGTNTGTFDWTEDFCHSPEDGMFVAILPSNGRYQSWLSRSFTYSESGDTISGTMLIATLLICANGVVNTYPITVENITPESRLIMQGNKIRMSISKENALIALSWGIQTSDPKGRQFKGIILLDSNYSPYIYYPQVRLQEISSKKIYTIAKQLLLNSATITDFGRGDFNQWYSQDLRVDVAGSDRSMSIVYFNSLNQDKLYSAVINVGNLVPTWPNNFRDKCVYVRDVPAEERLSSPLAITFSAVRDRIIGTFTNLVPKYKLGSDNNVLTDRYFRYADTNLPLLDRGGTNTPLLSEGDKIIYQDNLSDKIYTNNYTGKIYVDLFTQGVDNYIIPDRGISFMADTSVLDPFLVANIVSLNNQAFGSYKRDGQVYLPVSEIQSFSNEITALANFTKTSIGIFLEDEVYEWLYLDTVYALSRTKLQLGCRQGSNVLPNYDGKTLFVTTLKGLNALDYQDFVQSSEQVFSYLTENIMTVYDEYSISPLRLTQYKNWIFMYRQDVNYFYLFDLRNNSWWKWTCQNNPQQILFDGEDLLLLSSGIIYRFDFAFDGANYYDDIGQKIDWSCKSQRLHFNAPNNYKHIRSFSILTSLEKSTVLCCKLELKSYHDLYNMNDTEVVEYDIDELTTSIKKVNFMKLNAFQFTMSDDDNDKTPREFVTPDVAIKYRVTERVR